MADIKIRAATIEEAPLILGFIKELASYERAEDEVIASVKDIEQALFIGETNNRALICSLADKPIGFAVYFQNFSTWLGKNGLYLEDLYITPQYRGMGAGKKLLKYLAEMAVEKGFGRFEWSVLDWNESAIHFYESIGAKSQSEWVLYRLEGQSLIDFAES